MYEGAGTRKSDRQRLDEAFSRSRGAAIVLAITAGFTVIQTGVLAMNLPPGAFDLAAAGDETAALQVGTVIYVGLFCAFATTTMLFAWLMRSRIAMAAGLLLYALNWLDFIVTLMDGRFIPTGILMNVIAPIFLVRSIMAAQTYHKLRRAKPVDLEVFA